MNSLTYKSEASLSEGEPFLDPPSCRYHKLQIMKSPIFRAAFILEILVDI